MADPTIQTFCCHNRIHSETAVKLMAEFNKDSYILVCLMSSCLGIVGAIYQIFIRHEEEPREFTRHRTNLNTGRNIIIWLAVADLCAAIGVFTRSALWKYVKNIFPPENGGDMMSVVFCAVSSAWTQYFYMCTWIWTLCYAVNVKRTLHGKQTSEFYYHYLTWTLSAVLTAIGTTVLYIPDADCHDIHRVSTAFFRIMPNYLATYGPMVLVMIVNPIIYSCSTREVDKQIVARYSQMTSMERVIMDKFKMKFSLINLVFYVCWIPNLLNGIILWTMWFNLPIKVIIATWYMMAIMNPLQAFFNCLVYRKWICKWKLDDKQEERRAHRTSALIVESTPLLQHPSLKIESPSTSQVAIRQHYDEIAVKPTNSVNSCSLV